MKSEMVGHMLAFKADDVVCDRTALIEATDHRNGGVVEIAFDTNMRGVDRIYLSLHLHDLVRIALTMRDSDT